MGKTRKVKKSDSFSELFLLYKSQALDVINDRVEKFIGRYNRNTGYDEVVVTTETMVVDEYQNIYKSISITCSWYEYEEIEK